MAKSEDRVIRGVGEEADEPEEVTDDEWSEPSLAVCVQRWAGLRAVVRRGPLARVGD